ncbi:SPP1 Gp6-like portal protein [Herbihabitans rhizosphaerae]|uniref:SPP1 Gp6-like portal protein n=1 Tax=Herbihabitans rhizosphaerae TaxID=1872711 RepID=A0A4Q7KTJ5_9PSEU|nr:phage portal protein [Herbihabitans rhizosphaerae]RZS39141.1 SPP1 Gp6-like portal protein [Herbihabitans rhizosphaerae]
MTAPTQALVTALEREHARTTKDFRLYESYYDGEERLNRLGLAVPPEMRQLVVAINWPRLVVLALAERLAVEGFRLAGESETDKRLWDIWQDNDLDEESALAFIEALVQGRAYAVVGQHPDDPSRPLVTFESAKNLSVLYDPATRAVRAAFRPLFDSEDDRGVPARAMLYLPDSNQLIERRPGGQWATIGLYEHRLGEVLVTPLVNRARLSNRDGQTEMRDVVGLTDAACRAIMNLGVAQELMAVPQRYVLGASESDFKDADGNPIPAWQAYIGRYFAVADPDSKVGQFTAANLSNFTGVIEHYATNVSAVSSVPPSYLGFQTENPPSADAIRAGEQRLITRVESIQRSFSGGLERGMRQADRIAGGRGDAARLETVWRDPSTPTYAAKADAVAKLVSAGILPVEASWEDLGYSPERRRKLTELRDRDRDQDPAAVFARALPAIPDDEEPAA